MAQLRSVQMYASPAGKHVTHAYIQMMYDSCSRDKSNYVKRLRRKENMTYVCELLSGSVANSMLA